MSENDDKSQDDQSSESTSSTETEQLVFEDEFREAYEKHQTELDESTKKQYAELKKPMKSLAVFAKQYFDDHKLPIEEFTCESSVGTHENTGEFCISVWMKRKDEINVDINPRSVGFAATSDGSVTFLGEITSIRVPSDTDKNNDNK